MMLDGYPLKSYKDESLCFEAVFACHHAVDPLGVAMEILSKFGTDCKHIQAIAYRLIFRSSFSTETKLFWRKPSDPLDEILFPC